MRRPTRGHRRSRRWRVLSCSFRGPGRKHPERVDASLHRTDVEPVHVQGGDALDTPLKLRGGRVGAKLRPGSIAGRLRAAFGRCTGDRPSPRRDATCRRHEELVAHSIPGSRSPRKRVDARKSAHRRWQHRRREAAWDGVSAMVAFHHGVMVGEAPSGNASSKSSPSGCCRAARSHACRGLNDGSCDAVPDVCFLTRVSCGPSLPPDDAEPSAGLRICLSPVEDGGMAASSSGVERAPSRWRHRVGPVVVPRWPGRPGTRRDGAGTSVPVDEPRSCRGVERRELPHIAAVLASAGTHDSGEAVGRLLRASGWPRRWRHRRGDRGVVRCRSSSSEPRGCFYRRTSGPPRLRTSVLGSCGPWVTAVCGAESPSMCSPALCAQEDREVEALGPTPHDSVSVARLVCDRGIGAAPATRRWG